jgi:hypothetical protein
VKRILLQMLTKHGASSSYFGRVNGLELLRTA